MTNENTAPSERVMFAAQMEIQCGERVVLSQCASEWEAWQARAALASKQVANTDAVRDKALEEAANAVASTITLGMTAGSATTKLCAIIRALKSSPPAPQPENKP